MTPMHRQRIRLGAYFAGSLIASSFVFGCIVFLLRDSETGSADNPASLQTRASEVEEGTDQLLDVPEQTQPSGSLSQTDVDEFFDAISSKSPNRLLEGDGILSNLNQTELLELFQLLPDIPRERIRLEARIAVTSRLASIDPEAAWNLVNLQWESLRQILSLVVLSDWVQTDLYGAIERMQDLLYQTERGIALQHVFSVRDDLPDQTRLELAAQLYLEEHAADLLATQRSVSNARSTSESWFSLLNDEQAYDDKSWELRMLAEQWVDQEGVAVLAAIENAISNHYDRYWMLNYTLSHLSRSSPRIAFETAMDMFKNSDWELILNAADRWVEREPETAFAAISALETSVLQRRLLRDAARSWAQDEPLQVLERLHDLPQELRESAQSAAFNAVQHVSSADASRLIASVSEGERRRGLAQLLVQSWSRHDFGAALDWVLTNPDVEEFEEILLPNLFFHLTGVEAEAALTRILDKPVDKHGVGLEANLIGVLASTDLDLAQRLLPRVRNEDTKLAALIGIGVQVLHSEDLNGAWKLGSELSESRRERYEKAMVEFWVWDDGIRAFDSIDDLPHDRAKSYASLWLLWNERHHSVLSEEQALQLRSNLTEEDRQSLENGTVTSAMGFE